MGNLSSKHLMLFILASTLIGIRSYSSIFINLGGRDTWIFILLATVIILLFLVVTFKIIINCNCYDINLALFSQYPKFIGTTVLLLFCLGLFLLSIESVVVFSSSIHTNYFVKTPIWYCMIFFVACSTYVLFQKFNAIKTLVIITVSLTIIGDIFLLILLVKYLDLHELLPIMKNGMTKSNWLCLLSSIGSLSSAVIVFPYLKYLNKKHALITDSIFSMLICCFFVTTSIVSLISFLGPYRASNIYFPEYIQSQRIQIANFLEFGELFYIFRSVSMWFIKYILCSYGILLLLDKFIKKKGWFISLYSVMIFVISFLICKNQYTTFQFISNLQYILIIPNLLLPLICLLIYKCRKRAK